MAASVLLQEWNTVRGNLTTTTVTQQEHHYADLLHFQDVSLYMETSDMSGSPTITFQTSPTRDDNLFQAMDATGTFIPAVGVTVRTLRYSNVSVPLARFVRWKFTGSTAAPWSCTFRIWLSPNLS
jgi:hypothetical protein